MALVFGSVLVLFLDWHSKNSSSASSQVVTPVAIKSNTFLELGLGSHLLIDDYLIAGSVKHQSGGELTAAGLEWASGEQWAWISGEPAISDCII